MPGRILIVVDDASTTSLEKKTAAAIQERFRIMVRQQKIGGTLAAVIVFLTLGLLAWLLSVGMVLTDPLAFLFFGLFVAEPVVAVWLLYMNWSCPKCGRYLGRGQITPGWDITHCRYCGVRLR